MSQEETGDHSIRPGKDEDDFQRLFTLLSNEREEELILSPTTTTTTPGERVPFTISSARELTLDLSPIGARRSGDLSSERSKCRRRFKEGLVLPLKNGEPLPEPVKSNFDYQHLALKPLEEVDPYYIISTNSGLPNNDFKTFLMIGKDGIVHRFAHQKSSSFIPHPFNPLRRLALLTLTGWQLRLLLRISILLICLSFLLPTYASSVASNFVWKLSRYTFGLILFAEICVNVLGRGILVGELTYLRSPWDWLDLLVFSIVVVNSCWTQGSLHSLEGVLLLKIIPLVPTLKWAFHLTLQILRNLLPALLYSLLTLWILSVIGLHDKSHDRDTHPVLLSSMPSHNNNDTTHYYYLSPYTTTTSNVSLRPDCVLRDASTGLTEIDNQYNKYPIAHSYKHNNRVYNNSTPTFHVDDNGSGESSRGEDLENVLRQIRLSHFNNNDLRLAVHESCLVNVSEDYYWHRTNRSSSQLVPILLHTVHLASFEAFGGGNERQIDASLSQHLLYVLLTLIFATCGTSLLLLTGIGFSLTTELSPTLPKNNESPGKSSHLCKDEDTEGCFTRVLLSSLPFVHKSKQEQEQGHHQGHCDTAAFNKLYKLLFHPLLELFIALIICVDIVLIAGSSMASLSSADGGNLTDVEGRTTEGGESDQGGLRWKWIMTNGQEVCMILYVMEFAAKLSIGKSRYFKNWWPLIDLAVAVTYAINKFYPIPIILKFRVLKITSRWPTLQLIFYVAMKSLKTTLPLALILTLGWTCLRIGTLPFFYSSEELSSSNFSYLHAIGHGSFLFNDWTRLLSTCSTGGRDTLRMCACLVSWSGELFVGVLFVSVILAIVIKCTVKFRLSPDHLLACCANDNYKNLCRAFNLIKFHLCNRCPCLRRRASPSNVPAFVPPNNNLNPPSASVRRQGSHLSLNQVTVHLPSSLQLPQIIISPSSDAQLSNGGPPPGPSSFNFSQPRHSTATCISFDMSTDDDELDGQEVPCVTTPEANRYGNVEAISGSSSPSAALHCAEALDIGATRDVRGDALYKWRFLRRLPSTIFRCLELCEIVILVSATSIDVVSMNSKLMMNHSSLFYAHRTRVIIDFIFVCYFLILLLWKLLNSNFKYFKSPLWFLSMIIVMASGFSTYATIFHNSLALQKFWMVKVAQLLSCLKGLLLLPRVEWLKVGVRAIFCELRVLWRYLMGLFLIWLCLIWLKNGNTYFYYAAQESNQTQSLLLLSPSNNEILPQDSVSSTIANQSMFSPFPFQGDEWLTYGPSVPTLPLNILARDWLTRITILVLYLLLLGISVGVLVSEGVKVDWLTLWFMTPSQAATYKQKSSRRVQRGLYIPPPKKVLCAQVTHYAISTQAFDLCVTAVILSDCLVTTFKHLTTSRDWLIIWETWPTAITVTYIIELMFKIGGERKYFLKSPWNILDTFIVAVGVVDLTMFRVHPAFVTMETIRFLRILRIFQLKLFLKHAKLLRLFYSCFLRMMPTVGNFLLLLLLLVQIYATVGVEVGLFCNSHAHQMFFVPSTTGRQGNSGSLSDIYTCLTSLPFVGSVYDLRLSSQEDGGEGSIEPSFTNGGVGLALLLFGYSYLFLTSLILITILSLLLLEFYSSTESLHNEQSEGKEKTSPCVVDKSNKSKNFEGNEEFCVMEEEAALGIKYRQRSNDKICSSPRRMASEDGESVATMLTPIDPTPPVIIIEDRDDDQPVPHPPNSNSHHNHHRHEEEGLVDDEEKYPLRISANGYILHVEAVVTTV